MSGDAVDEIVLEFVAESRDNLDQLDNDLVELERDPSSAPLLSAIFRTIHTIKGTCGFLGFDRLETLAHAGESLLSRLRDGELVLDQARTDALLVMVDLIRELIGTIEATGAEGDVAVEAAVSALQEAGADEQATMDLSVQATDGEGAAPAGIAPAPVDPAPVGPGPVAVGGTAADDAAAPGIGALGEPAGAPEAGGSPDGASTPGARSSGDSTIRVDVAALDSLMSLVGELVLNRNQIVQYAGRIDDVELLRASQRLDLVASELQEGVMKTRMQPIDHVFSKLPRLVRDVSHQCGKKVRLGLEGGETELDKTLLEAVKDPITHLVRNAVDHGIETPSDRLGAGKTEEGRLVLRAFHEGGQVVVEVEDDGRGIDLEAVGSRAVQRGLVTAEQLARMSPHDVAELIFLPGFSTAASVTAVSGRGVGMDVVRTNIEKIGGTVDLSSSPGAGSTVRLKIPLTLAIIPALIVGEGGARYAIPQASLVELVRLDQESSTRSVEHVAGSPVLRLRGRLLPLVDLGEVFGEPGDQGGDAGASSVVVLQAEESQFGLVVDTISDTQEIVVKPLGRQLKGVSVFAGATIMGDGKVALILDVLGLAARAHALGQASGTSNEDGDGPGSAPEAASLLIVRAGERRLVLPLDSVSRIEELASEAVEVAGGRSVLQYRGELLPLIDLTGDGPAGLPGPDGRGAPPGRIEVVVATTEAGAAVGLVVDEIVDITEERLALCSVGSEPGVVGSMVVQGRVSDLLDLDALASRSGVALEVGHVA